MAMRTKIVKVKGHYRDQVVGATIKVDPDNPANETYIYDHKKVYIAPYIKVVKYDDGT